MEGGLRPALRGLCVCVCVCVTVCWAAMGAESIGLARRMLGVCVGEGMCRLGGGIEEGLRFEDVRWGEGRYAGAAPCMHEGGQAGMGGLPLHEGRQAGTGGLLHAWGRQAHMGGLPHA